MSLTKKPRVATTSLAGCFGCHMSLLDIDERILQLIELVDFDKSPIDDYKEFTQHCAVGLIEGGCCNEENVEVLRDFRKHCDILVSIGDCATMGGIPALRNMVPLRRVPRRGVSEWPVGLQSFGKAPRRRRSAADAGQGLPGARGRQNRLPLARLSAIGRHAVRRPGRAANRSNRWNYRTS